MVAVLEGSPVPRSICLTSASFGGARMLGFLAGISSSSELISVAIVAIFFYHRWLVPWLQFELPERRSQKRTLNHFEGKGHH